MIRRGSNLFLSTVAVLHILSNGTSLPKRKAHSSKTTNSIQQNVLNSLYDYFYRYEAFAWLGLKIISSYKRRKNI